MSEATARETPAVAVVPAAAGSAPRSRPTPCSTKRAAPPRTVLLCDLPDGARTLVASDDAAFALRATREELCGRDVRITEGGGVQ